MNRSPNNSSPNNSQPGSYSPDGRGSGQKAGLRRFGGVVGGVLSIVFMAWLPLGILGVVPFALVLPGESALRTHAGVAVTFLMVTAWAYWEE